jgi:NAD(P)-dependent dehydrogenase (short-subunit alcohol dehydrogenase family)
MLDPAEVAEEKRIGSACPQGKIAVVTGGAKGSAARRPNCWHARARVIIADLDEAGKAAANKIRRRALWRHDVRNEEDWTALADYLNESSVASTCW